MSRCVIRGMVAESVGVDLEYKIVAIKEDPGQLIATDATICHVSSGRYREVEVGDPVECAWSSKPTHGRAPGRHAPDHGAR